MRYAILYRPTRRAAWELSVYHGGTWRAASTSAQATILQDRSRGVTESQALVADERDWDRYIAGECRGRLRARWRSR